MAAIRLLSRALDKNDSFIRHAAASALREFGSDAVSVTQELYRAASNFTEESAGSIALQLLASFDQDALAKAIDETRIDPRARRVLLSLKEVEPLALTMGIAKDPMIEATDLSKFYGDFTACRDVTFSIYRREIAASGFERCRQEHHHEVAHRLSGTVFRNGANCWL